MVSYAPDGRILAGYVAMSSKHKDLDDAALNIAITRYRIGPARSAGQPIKTVVCYAMEWTLNGLDEHRAVGP
jgi:hypothetical protein